jgi:hypothetical protein
MLAGEEDVFMASDDRARGAKELAQPGDMVVAQADQGALSRPLPVSWLLYPLSETLISDSSAISPISNTPSLSVPPYRISHQFVHKLCINAHYLATNNNDQFLRFLDHMTIRHPNYA